MLLNYRNIFLLLVRILYLYSNIFLKEKQYLKNYSIIFMFNNIKNNILQKITWEFGNLKKLNLVKLKF